MGRKHTVRASTANRQPGWQGNIVAIPETLMDDFQVEQAKFG
jgi:hypothetical protein